MRNQDLCQRMTYLLLAMCLLNANGVAYMALGVDRAVSAGMAFLAAGVLWTNGLRLHVSVAWLLVSLLAFLLGSLAFSLVHADSRWVHYLSGPAGAIVIIAAIAAGASTFKDKSTILRFVKLVTVPVSIATIASPILYQVYENPPPDVLRASGLFGNPNEAAIVSVIGVGLAFDGVLRRRAALDIGILGVSALAVFLTFSKAGMLAALLIMVWLTFRVERGNFRLASIFLVIGALLSSHALFSALGANLESRQRDRVAQVGRILAGEINDETSTNRLDTWKAGLEEIEGNYVLMGSGLGSMRAVEGGLFEDGAWKGVHNLWLMLLGEAGLLSFPMIYLLLRLIWRSIRTHPVTLGVYPIALLVDSMSSHNILELRFHAAMLGLWVVLLAAARSGELEGGS